MAQMKGLQVLRAIAACAVVYSHAYNRAERSWTADIGRSTLDRLPVVTQFGHFGVDLFFILSGFLMMYLHREAFGRPGAWRDFLMRRIARIVPLYWTLSTLALALLLIIPQAFSYHKGVELPWVLGCYLFIPIPMRDGFAIPVIGAGWTLDFEMYFYALFTVALLSRRGLALLFVVLTLSTTIGLAFSLQHPLQQLVTAPMLLDFLMGAIVALAVARWQVPPRTARTLMYVAVVLIIAGSFAYVNIPPVDTQFAPADVTRIWTWGIPCTLLVASVVWWNPRCEGLVGHALVTVGDASYSIYLFQVFALPAIAIVLRKMHAPSLLPVDVAIALLWLLSCAAGIGCWAFLERPLTARLKRKPTRRDLPLAQPR
jgi:exopolysaccharide production protein ExoZ